MLAVEDAIRELIERVDVARPRGGEPPDGDAAKPIGALRILVLPGDVVAGARGEDVDLVVLGDALGDEAAVEFGPAEDLGAIALNDEGNSHATSDNTWRNAVSSRSLLKSCRRRRCPLIT